ncbi:Serine/threonine/tyrosine-interacting protein B [Durusdinium trenchii]|uniref:Serine/threonine/tyrosine-interacting protein B n=1 Tax=Durusdinium trenchii TaxID=1381693 RepID=A0ABP0NQN4_9DINO
MPQPKMLPWLHTMVQPCITCQPCRSESEPKKRHRRTTFEQWMTHRQPFVPRPLPQNAWHRIELVFSPLANMQGLLGYHSSVLVDGEEYYFSPSGIRCYPKLSSHRRMSVERVDVGESVLGGATLLDVLSKHFQPRTYDLLRKNCNNFTARTLRHSSLIGFLGWNDRRMGAGMLMWKSCGLTL